LDADNNANALATAEAAKAKGKYQRQAKASFARRFGDLRGTTAEQERLKLFKIVANYGKMVTPDPSILEGSASWTKIVPALLLIDPFRPPNSKGGRRTYGMHQIRQERIGLLSSSNEQLELAKSYMKALVDSNFESKDDGDFHLCIGTDPEAMYEFFRSEDEPLETEEEEQQQQQDETAAAAAAAAASNDEFGSMFNTPARTD